MLVVLFVLVSWVLLVLFLLGSHVWEVGVFRASLICCFLTHTHTRVTLFRVPVCAVLVAQEMFFKQGHQAQCIFLTQRSYGALGEEKADHLPVPAQWTGPTSTNVQSAVNRSANQ